MEAFKVSGKKLSGTIKPQGAKNEAQVISAVLLTEKRLSLIIFQIS